VTHISRPFQIALAAAVLLAGVWFFALRSHSPSSESSGSSSASSAPAASSAPSSSAPSKSTPAGSTKALAGTVHHGSAPAAAGLNRTIERAQGAVKQSEQAHRTSTTTATHARSAAKPTPATHATTPPKTQTQTPGVASRPAKQALVEAELKGGRTVIVLFWNPKGSVDVAVHRQLASLHGARDRNVAVHYSSAAEVGQYGAITRSLQVFQTPTMLVIAPSGNTKTLTGLVDAYAIGQAIGEAHSSH
jgi:hypothetical protein